METAAEETAPHIFPPRVQAERLLIAPPLKLKNAAPGRLALALITGSCNARRKAITLTPSGAMCQSESPDGAFSD